MSNARSTACRREPRGQNVLRCVVVAVVFGVAMGARPSLRAEGETADAAARTARLAARVEAVDLDQRPSVPRALVVELSQQFSPPCHQDGSRETTVAKQAAHVQVLDDDRLVFANESSAELVQKVSALVGRPRAHARQLEARALLVSGALLLSRDAPRERPLSFATTICMPGVCNAFPVREHDEVRQSDVHADRSLHLRQRANARVRAEDGDVPPARRVEGHSCARRPRVLRQRTRPANRQRRRHASEPQLGAFHAKAVACECSSATPAPRSESRVAPFLPKEPRVGGLQLPDGLLQRNARHVLQECKVRVCLPPCQPSTLFRISQVFLVPCPSVAALLQRAVVDEAAAPDSSTEKIGLLRRRVHAVAEGAEHTLRLASPVAACNLVME